MCRRRWALHTRVDPRVSDYRAYDGMLPCILLACQRTASVIAKSMCTVRGNRIELVIERGASQRCRQALERKVRSPKGFPRSNIEEFEISNAMGFFFFWLPLVESLLSFFQHPLVLEGPRYRDTGGVRIFD